MKDRILGLLKPLSKLNNPWVIRGAAILLFVSTAAGGVYLGVQRFGKKTVEGTPTKKVVTGIADAGEAEAEGDAATASLAPPTALPTSPGMPPATYASTSSKYGDYGQSSYSDDSTPVNPYRQVSTEVAQPTTEAPPANPYSYGAYGSADESPAEVQVAANEPANQPATNPYAISDPTPAEYPSSDDDAAMAAGPPSTAMPVANQPPPSPYGEPAEPTPAAVPQQADPADAYANPYNQLASSSPAAEPAAAPAMSPSAIPLPPNTLAGGATLQSTADLNAGSPPPAPATLQPVPSSSPSSAGGAIPSTLGSQGYGAASNGGGPLAGGALGGAAIGGGVGVPGDRHLEGLQAPSVTIEKIAPPEVQIGKQATFQLRVRNVGQTPAANVVVTDQVPRGVALVDAHPEYTRTADGGLAWNLGTLQPGAEVTIQMQVMPQEEGEIGSVAQVAFAAQATSRSISTRPLVAIEHTAPPKVMIGQQFTVSITVSNPGTGAATGLVIEEDVPEGFVHAAGSELEYEIGMLRPGETKRLELSLKADKPGIIENTILVRGDGNLSASHRLQVEVVAPQLQVEVNGPKKRFLQRQATYTVSIANPGTAAARDVELVAYLPRGMKFVQTDSQGQYDPQQHAVFWSLEELPAAKSGEVTLVTVPVEAGEQRLRVEGKADLGLAAVNEQTVQVDAASELRHTITDLSDPIEVGSATAYEVRVTNTGTKTATNVRIVAVLPAEMRLVSGEGPTQGLVQGQQLVFEPLPRLNPQEEAVFKVHAQGLRSGDHLIRVQLSSDEWPTPVSREESTRVYEDR